MGAVLAAELAQERERLRSLRRSQQTTSQRRQAMQLEHEARSARLVQLRANIDAGEANPNPKPNPNPNPNLNPNPNPNLNPNTNPNP